MIDFLNINYTSLFRIEKLSAQNLNESFSISSEYSDYYDFLYKDALNYQELNISDTYLLIENQNNDIAAYISLVTDTVALNPKEKKKYKMDSIPFTFIPALKIAKLAVSAQYGDYKNIGSFMISFAKNIANKINDEYAACRILSLDADIENNPNVINFYVKNGFQPLKSNIYKRKFPNRTKIVGMWKDILGD